VVCQKSMGGIDRNMSFLIGFHGVLKLEMILGLLFMWIGPRGQLAYMIATAHLPW